MKLRLVPMVAVATAALALFAAGCGGSDGGSGSDPAALAPPKSPLYIEATVRPEGELKTNVESLAKSIAGVGDLGGLIVSELERDGESTGEPVDFEKEVEPWLGKRGGLFFQEYDGNDFNGYGFAIQVTDAEAAQDFVDKRTAASDVPVKEDSYEGVDFDVASDDGLTSGVIDDFVVTAEDEAIFKAMVDASEGESLADGNDFANTFGAAAEGSFADVFVDIGALVDQSGGQIDPEARQFLDSAGIKPDEATAVASLIPASDQVEIDVSTDLSGANPPRGDASELLGALPADSVAAVAAADFGKRFKEAIDQIDANGIEEQVPPHKFKSGLKEAGIDVEKIASSLGDLGVFATGSSESSLGGAAVLTTTSSSEATNTVANVGLLLRASNTPGVTSIGGELSGFFVRSEDLGRKPLVVAAKGERIAIAYGLPAARQALATDSGGTLADSPVYKEAISALGSTPISGFVDGPAALKLAGSLVTGDDREGFLEAKPYLKKIAYLAIGSGASSELGTAKLIAGIGK